MSVLISFLVYCCLFARSPQVGLLYPRSNVSVVAPVGWISSQVLYKSISALIELKIMFMASVNVSWRLTLQTTGPGTALAAGFSALYFPMGNEATGFMVLFSLIAAVVGAASCLSGLHHLRVWTAQSLASSAASSMTAWALTVLAMGLACKEIHIGGRNTKLITLESFLIILCGTKLWYILLIHGGFFGGNYCCYEDTYIATTTTTAEPQKGSTTVTSSV